MPPKMDESTTVALNRINKGPADIHGIGVDVCKEIQSNLITPNKYYQLCEAIVADIFHEAGLEKLDAAECFNAILGRIHKINLFSGTTLDKYSAMKCINHFLDGFMKRLKRTKKTICAPATVMAYLIAAIAYRKLKPASEEFFQQNKDLSKVFGELNGVQWLPVALQVWDKVGGQSFIIELDENNQKPIAELQVLKGKAVWVVTTRMPQMNRYEELFRKTFYPAIPEPGPAIPKLEPDDNILTSVEPNDISNEAITLSDDDEESEDNTITLRDYTRQMKTLAKRLSTPDRVIARRARKEIMKKPHEVGEEEVEESGPPKEYFDSYTHFKDVWKTCLKNRVSIPNSLRVLIDHHCTPSQVFHLMELEKEHLAETGMEVDG